MGFFLIYVFLHLVSSSNIPPLNSDITPKNGPTPTSSVTITSSSTNRVLLESGIGKEGQKEEVPGSAREQKKEEKGSENNKEKEINNKKEESNKKEGDDKKESDKKENDSTKENGKENKKENETGINEKESKEEKEKNGSEIKEQIPEEDSISSVCIEVKK